MHKRGKLLSVGITTIKIAPETRKRLMALGVKGQTYDQILNALIDFWETRHHGKR